MMRKTAGLLSAILLAIAGMGSFAYASNEPSQTTHEHRHRMELHHHHAHPLATVTHHAMYMQLLAERYTPDAAPAWKKVMDERAAIVKSIRELRMKRKAGTNEGHEKASPFSEQQRDEMKAHRALIASFTDAVQAKDEKAIKTVLPELLKSEQRMNDTLQKWLDSERKQTNS